MTKVIISVDANQATPVVVMENYVGQRQNRVANVILPGVQKEFVVHSHLSLQVMEVNA